MMPPHLSSNFESRPRSRRKRAVHATNGLVLLLALACGGNTISGTGSNSDTDRDIDTDGTHGSTSSRANTSTTSRSDTSTTRSTAAVSSVTYGATATTATTATTGPTDIGASTRGNTSTLVTGAGGAVTTGWNAGGTGGDFSGTGGGGATGGTGGDSSTIGGGGAAGAPGDDSIEELCQADCEHMAAVECDGFTFDYCMYICMYYVPTNPGCAADYASFLECDIQSDISENVCLYGLTGIPAECYDEFEASLCL